MKKFKLTSSANGKVFRSGVYSTAILAAAIVLAVLLNLLVGALPKKYTSSIFPKPRCILSATAPKSWCRALTRT